MKRQLMTTADGSSSLFVPALDEHYHSIHGAIQESKHVFIQAGFAAVDATITPLHILEMGLGTGLNALLTYLSNKNSSRTIYYTALEAHPLTVDLAQQLNYPAQLSLNQIDTDFFKSIHTAPLEQIVEVAPNFFLHKIPKKLEDVDLLNKHFHLVYFDAFAPSAQPELWTEMVFQKIYNSMTVKGVMTTYCAKGVVKRRLKKLGFMVESLPGPPRKREMTRARVA